MTSLGNLSVPPKPRVIVFNGEGNWFSFRVKCACGNRAHYLSTHRGSNVTCR